MKSKLILLVLIVCFIFSCKKDESLYSEFTANILYLGCDSMCVVKVTKGNDRMGLLTNDSICFAINIPNYLKVQNTELSIIARRAQPEEIPKCFEPYDKVITPKISHPYIFALSASKIQLQN